MFVKDTQLLNFTDVFLGIPFRFSFFLCGIYQQSLERGRDILVLFFFPSMCDETGVSSVEFLQAEEPYLGVIVGCQYLRLCLCCDHVWRHHTNKWNAVQIQLRFCRWMWVSKPSCSYGGSPPLTLQMQLSSSSVLLVLGSLWTSSVTAGCSQQGRDAVWLGFEHLQGWKLHSLTGWPVSVFSHPYSFFNVDKMFLISNVLQSYFGTLSTVPTRS